MNRLLLLFTILPAISSFSFVHTLNAAQASAEILPIRTYDNASLLQNFILTDCIKQSFNDDYLHTDINRAKMGYIEYSNFNLSDYQHISELIKEWLEQNNSSESEKKPKLMKCIELHRSMASREIVGIYMSRTYPLFKNFAYDRCTIIAKKTYNNTTTTETDKPIIYGSIHFNISVSSEANAKISSLAKKWLNQPILDNEIDTCEAFSNNETLSKTISFYAKKALSKYNTDKIQE